MRTFLQLFKKFSNETKDDLTPGSFLRRNGIMDFNEGKDLFHLRDTMGEVEVTLSAVLTIVLSRKVTCFDSGPLKYDSLPSLFAFGDTDRPTAQNRERKSSGRRKREDEQMSRTVQIPTL